MNLRHLQAESGPWRNFYLTGAQELRDGTAAESAVAPGTPHSVLRSMSIDMIFDSLAVRLHGPDADGRTISVNWDFTDVGEQWVLGLEHGAMHYHPGADDNAVASLRLSRTTFAEVLGGQTQMIEAVTSGAITIDGDAGALVELFGFLETPIGHFNIVIP